MTELELLEKSYKELCSRELSLNLTRGKPGSEQLDLSNELDGVLNGDFQSVDGTDVRNYGGLRGIPEIREIGGRILGLSSDNVIAGGNSSLHLMYLTVDQLVNWGLAGPPLSAKSEISALCPVPGYDRHFTLTQRLGIDMINVPLTDTGPDMNRVEELVRNDLSTSFIWCVPKHSNPTGCTYNSETVDRLAALPALRNQVPDSPFYVLWDNAYALHDFLDPHPELDSIYERARQHGTEDRIVQFASTSKITFAGGGVSFVGGSDAILESFDNYLFPMTVGFDKVNQLRHARFFGGSEGLLEHMQKHAQVLRPKFEAVQKGLAESLGNRGIATWTQPTGGYFVSLDVKPGLASAVVQLAQDAGLSLTPAGATFPYGNDPNDSNIRIAPTFASLTEVESAMDVLGTCVRLAAARQKIEKA
ncbi:MAG: aminotransferase class I/II-fold pyridoxal phosphate-dependent enzyme [Gammaproteobacteria bacterium]|nr:aminotransferase class I/II-fold pyridoxal phosphate-dependent enzyme [Gammaproteobacteria bacterium]